jgi:hypothetical protein
MTATKAPSCAAVDLAGPKFDQLLGGVGQGRLAQHPTCGVEVLAELHGKAVVEEVQAGIHGGFLS